MATCAYCCGVCLLVEASVEGSCLGWFHCFQRCSVFLDSALGFPRCLFCRCHLDYAVFASVLPVVEPSLVLVFMPASLVAWPSLVVV